MSTSNVNKLSRFSNFSSMSSSKWESLPARDKLALIILAVFLFAVFGVYGGWQVHQQASKQQAGFDNKLNEFFWLRSQAGNLKNQTGNEQANASQGIDTQINQMMQQAGVQNPQVVGNNQSVQFSFQHASQPVVSKLITDMQNKGWQIDRLSIQQQLENQSLQVQGIIRFAQ